MVEGLSDGRRLGESVRLLEPALNNWNRSRQVVRG